MTGLCFSARLLEVLRHLKPDTRNPKPETPTAKHQIRNTKPETRNPKPETRNTNPETTHPRPWGHPSHCPALEFPRSTPSRGPVHLHPDSHCSALRVNSHCSALLLQNRTLPYPSVMSETRKSLCGGYRGGLVFEAHRLLYHST